ncbi:MAG TPA: STAS domain-containing protein [Solirubrobacteraceae bacterium]|jgi:anti-sigma B factor antagonist|nr:STAS domain-containing protein [Solirubrobacteraceae bacterium]
MRPIQMQAPPVRAAAMPEPGLRLESRVEGRRHTIALRGELDLSTVDELEAMMAGACSNGAGELVLDLDGLSFMDSTGVRAALIAAERCEEHGCELLLARPRPPVRRLLELTGVLPRLRLIELSD